MVTLLAATDIATLMYVIGSILIIPAIIFALIAQMKVMSAFNKYSEIPSAKGMNGGQLARRLLDQNGCSHVKVERSRGHLSDHYDPKKRVVRLSGDVHDSASLAALGIAAHEVGHAIQHQTKYAPLMLRQIVIRYTSIVNKLLLPLIIIGLIASIFVTAPIIFGIEAANFWFYLIIAFCALYGISFLINLITLPTEFDASRRAKKMLNQNILADNEEYNGVSKVLSAAAMTYVAAFIVSLAYFMRFLGLVLMMTRKR